MNSLHHLFAKTVTLVAISLSFLVLGTSFAATDVSIENIDSARFPTIFSNVTVKSNGSIVTDLVTADFQVTEDGRPQTIQVTPPGTSVGNRRADVVFLIDVSGSMGSEIADVRSNVNAFAEALAASNVDFSLGLVRFGYRSGPNPYIYNNGNLTSDVTEFQGFVSTLRASGGYEPGFLALREAAKQFVFRAGAQKIFIIITDEDSDDRNKADTIALMQSGNITVHAAVKCSSGKSNSDYCDDTSVRATTGGLLFGVQDPYGSILDTIAEATSATYVVRYKTDKPDLDGIERLVEIQADVAGELGSDTGTYIPGAAPAITLTPETESTGSIDWLADTPLKITVNIVDEIEPLVSNARLYYRWAGSTSSEYSSTSMSFTGGSIWEATIPGSVVQDHAVEFYITTTDGQSTSSLPLEKPDENPINIGVLPNKAPVITLIRPGPVNDLPRIEGLPVPIIAEFHDSTNEIVQVSLHYRKPGDLLYQVDERTVNDTDPTLVTEIPGQFVQGSRVEFYLSATDDLGVTRTYGANGSINGADNPILLPIEGARQQVLFIHGAMGSELIEKDALAGIDNERWPSTQEDDVLRLKVNENGSGKEDPTIYVKQDSGGVIKAHLGFNVYKKFLGNTVEKNDDPNLKWNVFVYDWRLGFDDKMKMKPYDGVCNAKDGDEIDGEICTKSILDALQAKITNLAVKDPHGKVDVVAHSLGGLLTKYYISKNQDNTLIRKFIIVDSPQLGTPAGAAVVMHGEHGLTKKLKLWLGLKKATMREITTYMTPIYLLTPSQHYFDAVAETDSKGLLKVKDQKKYEPILPIFVGKDPGHRCRHLYDGPNLLQFIRKYGSKGIREFDDWQTFFEDPGKIGETDYSKYIYPLTSSGDEDRKDRFDDGVKLYKDDIGQNWKSGDVENIYQFVGENLPTLVRIEYRIDSVIGSSPCSLDYKPIDSPVGDGTVVRESQDALNVPTFYVDMGAYNEGVIRNRDHSTVLEIPWVQEQLIRLLKDEGYQEGSYRSYNGRCLSADISDAATPCVSWERIVYTSQNEPSNRKVQWTRWNVKSPVDIHVYDSMGNHTGSTLQGAEEGVPNSTYYKVGTHKYVSLPIGYDDLVVEFRGTDTGSFSLTVEQYDHTELVKTLDYFDVPVTTDYRGRIVFKQFADIANIKNDNDGDGTYESSTSPINSIVAASRGAYYLEGRYRAIASLNVQANPVAGTASGWLKFSTADASGRKSVMISQIDLVQPETTDQITVKAPCTLNNQPGYNCTVGIFDGGTPRANKDFFSIEITGPNDYFYRSSGTISGGDISLTIQ